MARLIQHEMNKSLLPAFFLVFSGLYLSAQTCNYLAYDAFNYTTNTPLQGLSGGSGWREPWQVQNGITNLPGYQVSSGSPLQWLDLQTGGLYAEGGYQYVTSGRGFNLQNTGPFVPWLDNDNTIGKPGTTLWFSVMLRKTNNNDQSAWASLHDSNLQWCNDCTSNKVAVGYFGTNSNVSGERRWTLRIGNDYYPSTMPVVVGQTAFLVLKLEFQSGSTIASMFVNPTSLGNDLPAPTPSVVETSGFQIKIRSLALYLGDGTVQGNADEIRVGESYACVAPDPNIMVNQPPVAAFTFTPSTGMAPLTVNFDATTSSDPDGSIASYAWNFGDGSPQGSGATVSHVFQATGVLTIQLTVTDNLGLQNIVEHEITVLNQYGTFTCQLGVVCEQLATCTGNDGRFRVTNYRNVPLQLRNSGGALIPPTSGNSNLYNQLAPGQYTLTANGSNGCKDTFQLYVQRDSNTCPGWSPNPCAMKIGAGIEGLAYWSTGRPFKDFFKNCGEWITYDLNPPGGNFQWNTNNLQNMPADANGYPTQVPFAVPDGSGMNAVRGIFSAVGFVPVGVPLRLLYDGVGVLQLQGAVTVTSNTPGQIDFTVNDEGNIFFNMTFSDVNDHVRNIRVIEVSNADTYLTQPFRQSFLDKCAPFNTLRFMDWMQTNGNEQVSWANRTLPNHYSQSVTPHGGVAYEYIIQVANLMHKDIWICIPHQADDNYVTQMATLFRDQLDPGIRVYIEYSNEVWNWIFAQTSWVDANGPQNISYPRRYVERAQHAFDIWMNVWGGQNTRLKRVLGTQNGYDWVTEEIMAHADQDKYDYISPSWYVGLDHSSSGVPNLQALGASATPEDVLANANNVFTSFYPHWKMVYNTAKLYGKKVVNYEGGQHFTNFTVPPYIQSMYDAQVLPGMYDLYDRMLDSLRRLGSELPLAFVLTGPWESIYGSWGHIFDEDDPAPWNDRPKYQVLLDQIGQCAVSLAVELADFGVKCQPDFVKVSWTTASEKDHDYFELESSFDGINWQTKKRISGKGAGRYQVKIPLDQVGSFMRLRSVDLNGHAEVSGIEVVQCPTAGDIRIFPNPTTGVLYFDIPEAWQEERLQVRLFDAHGRPVLEQYLRNNQLSLDDRWPAGLYLLEITDEQGRRIKTHRVVKP
ncbi:MAG: PKD domain-containing protein [Saprospiraceae bacterium]|nr:PKD domain-containing protein [Saprospiraceae bacterium]